MVNQRPQRLSDPLQAHYTGSKGIVDYMVSLLDPVDTDTIWEPCGGKGDLVDGVLRLASPASLRISEINKQDFDFLNAKYDSRTNIQVFNEDGLDVGARPLIDHAPRFTGIIANPPYGAWQSPQRRSSLKKRFPGLYVRDTYAVFLYHCLNLLEPNGRLVFIIPDTFLWLNRHEFLRRTLLQNYTIEQITLFPSKFFPGVNFGYSGLSIISLSNSLPSQDSHLLLIDQVSSPEVLSELAQKIIPLTRCVTTPILQKQLLANDHIEITKPSIAQEIVLSPRTKSTLGNLAEVRTGFYSGNNRIWLRRKDATVARSKEYKDVCNKQIRDRYSDYRSLLKGLKGQQHFIPILRGGAAPFVKSTDWYVDWSESAVIAYRQPGDNPARFQNSKFYFQQGIGVPMVASTRLTASLLDNRLFDQSIVGIFPKDYKLLLFILGFLNTNLAHVLLRRINNTANNSANYLKRIPVAIPNEQEIAIANKIVTEAVHEVRIKNCVSELTAQRIEDFYRRIWCDPKEPKHRT